MVADERTSFIMFVTLSLFFVLFLQTGGKTSIHLEQKNIKLLERTLSAFEKALDFYKQDYGFINFDSLFGLRVAQGSLRQTLIDIRAKPNTNAIKKGYRSHITKLYMAAEKIANKASPFVRKSNADEYKKFYMIIRKPWDLFQRFQKLNKPVTVDKNIKFVNFDGRTSDHCIHLLLKESNTKRQSSCNVTDFCWEYETQKDLSGYTPTHQVLYFLFGLAEGCGNIFNEWFTKTGRSNGVQDFFAEICSNILQSKKVVKDTRMSERDKDLSMEQTLVCSLTGYEDFLSVKYLNIVLEWQTDIGCYGNKIPERVKGPGRTLLFEKRLKNGCLVHETGVGIALLGQYIRWILRTLGDNTTNI